MPLPPYGLQVASFAIWSVCVRRDTTLKKKKKKKKKRKKIYKWIEPNNRYEIKRKLT